MTIPISPVLIWAPGGARQATQLILSDVGTVTFDKTVSLDFSVQTADGSVLARGSTELTADQYNSWSSGSDVTYIGACTLTNLGLSAAS